MQKGEEAYRHEYSSEAEFPKSIEAYANFYNHVHSIKSWRIRLWRDLKETQNLGEILCLKCKPKKFFHGYFSLFFKSNFIKGLKNEPFQWTQHEIGRFLIKKFEKRPRSNLLFLK